MAIGDLNPVTWRIDVYELNSKTPFAGVITDLSNLYTSDLTITKQRNYPDEIKFTLDLAQLEERAKSLKLQSRDIIQPYRHKIRCYRNNKFMAQGIVVKVTANLNNESKNTLEVQCVDTLGLLEKRLIHQDYGEGSWADFAKEIIYDAQHEPNRVYNYAWEGDGVSVNNAWFRGWKFVPGEDTLRDFPEWEPNHLYSMYDTCTHDAKFWEAKEHAFYSGETFSESNWTLLGILDEETGDVEAAYGVWREDEEERGPTGTALGGWGGTSSCHMTSKSFNINNGGDISSISMKNSTISTSLVAPFEADDGAPELPLDYQEVEYIENASSGAYTETGIYATENSKVQIKFRPLDTTEDVILGNFPSDTTDWRFFNYGQKIYYDLPGGSGVGNRIISSAGECVPNNDYEFEFGNFYAKNVGASSDIVSGTVLNDFTTSQQLYINGPTNTPNGGSKNRWYYLKFFYNNNLIAHMVPCRRRSDNKPGFYDIRRGTFFPQKGSGIFTCGPDVTYPSEREVKNLVTTAGAVTHQDVPAIDSVDGEKLGKMFAAGYQDILDQGIYPTGVSFTGAVGGGCSCYLTLSDLPSGMVVQQLYLWEGSDLEEAAEALSPWGIEINT